MPSADDFSRNINSSPHVLDGCLFQPSPAKESHILGFVCNQHAHNALFLIPGLTEGFMSLKWTHLLAHRLKSLDVALIQVNLMSSFNGFGFSSLKVDAEELSQLIRFARDRWGYKKCFLLGHSTGAQICNSYMQQFKDKAIDAVIFHCGISDREAMATEKELDSESLNQEACALIENGESNRPLTKTFFSAPITAYRFNSMYKRLGDDDMFSTDLSEDELTEIFKYLNCPTLMIYGENDEYVPDKNRLAEFSKKLCAVLKELGCQQMECRHMPGNHGFTDEWMYIPMVEEIARFLQTIL